MLGVSNDSNRDRNGCKQGEARVQGEPCRGVDDPEAQSTALSYPKRESSQLKSLSGKISNTIPASEGDEQQPAWLHKKKNIYTDEAIIAYSSLTSLRDG